jgi:ferredoxin
VNKIRITQAKYIFAVVTRGWPVVGGAVNQIQRLLKDRGYTLNAGMYIHLPMSHFIVASVPPVEKQKKIIENSARQICESIEMVKNNQTVFPVEITSFLRKFRNGPFVKDVNNWDKNFHVTDTCRNCKICEKICPVGNITMNGNIPSWNHKCQLCLSCFHYCPDNAIQFADKSLKSLQYHHPDIKAADLIKLRAKKHKELTV